MPQVYLAKEKQFDKLRTSADFLGYEQHFRVRQFHGQFALIICVYIILLPARIAGSILLLLNLE